VAQGGGSAQVSTVPSAAGANPDIEAARRTPLYRRLYVQVLCAIIIGALLGYLWPDAAQQLKPLGDLFIRLVKMMIEPIVFTTVVAGIAKMGDLKQFARIGIRALLYFEIVSAAALLLGLLVVNVYRPGDGVVLDLTSVDTARGSAVASGGMPVMDFLLHMIPETVVGAFAKGETLQVLFFSVLFGIGLSALGTRARPAVELIDLFSQAFFGIIQIIMRFAPLGAFGAMAFTVGKYGLATLNQLGLLMAGMYTTCGLFIFGVLGVIAWVSGFSLWRFLRYIREEILIVVGTSTSESVLPRLMVKLEQLGCGKSVVGLVVPTGYSFNLDGTSIYLSMATLFIAQAAHIHLSWEQQLGILGVLLLTSKGSAAVTGGGFITLAATLSSTHAIPVAGLALLVGVDRFMSEARALTNLIGNGVATVVIAKWEGSLDIERMRRELKSGG
jgi:aerobic C4-dicarboxylate transport protein